MLKISDKQMSISGTSEIDGEPVATFGAYISTDGAGNSLNQSIQNSDLYIKNKEAVRKDLLEFQEYANHEEDKLINAIAKLNK